MRAFDEFKDMDKSFWAFIKFISETIGYTDRGRGLVRVYQPQEIIEICNRTETAVDEWLLRAAIIYLNKRAELLNGSVKNKLMDVQGANQEYLRLEQIHRLEHYYCKLPMNKQKGEMKQKAFFTSIINILAEKTIRDITHDDSQLGFDDDPRSLSYVKDNNGYVIGASSRRFDGAYPNAINPRLIWEIKEYYYNKSFGSRIADGVFETQLDGVELQEIYNRTGMKVYHVLFIDAYVTWWEKGKSYLCRLVDALNSGAVDEVIVGREVLTRWPELLREIILSE